jgi:predicted SnoaL-like aldol condensation-catalyzing enzyme
MENNKEQRNKALVRAFIQEVLNKHDIAAADKYYAVNQIEHNPQIPQGREGFKKYFANFFSAFPDAHTTIEHIAAEGDNVIVFLEINATHKGALQCFQATGKQVTMKSADLFRIEDGQIIEHWDVVDSLGMMMAIEAVSVNPRS